MGKVRVQLPPEQPRAGGTNTADFEAFYSEWRGPVLGFLTKQLGNPAAAEDCLQETFIRAYRQWETQQPIRYPISWLQTIARNVAHDHVKSEKRQERVDAPAVSDDTVMAAADPQSDTVAGALANIEHDDAKAFVLRHLHGYSTDEIAELEATSSRTIQRRLIAARNALAVVLGALLLTAVSGSYNPTVWLQHIRDASAACYDSVRGHGLGGLPGCALDFITPGHNSASAHSGAGSSTTAGGGGGAALTTAAKQGPASVAGTTKTVSQSGQTVSGGNGTAALTSSASPGVTSVSTPAQLAPLQPTTGRIAGIGTIVWGTNYAAQTNLSNWSVTVLDLNSDSKAASISGLTLETVWPTAVNSGYWTGVNYTEASPGWLLYCADGSQALWNTNEPLTNVGNSAYQQQFLSETASRLATYKYKGAYLGMTVRDAMEMKPKCASTGKAATYPLYNNLKQVAIADQASYQSAMLSFIAAVGSGLKAQGYYVEGNALVTGDSDGSLTRNWASAFHSYVSAIGVNGFMEVPQVSQLLRSTGTSAWYENWDGWETTEAYIQSLGVDFDAEVGYSPTCVDDQYARYTRASFLMEWNGSADSTWTWKPPGSSCDHWDSIAGLNPGKPSASRTQLQTGVWQRNFSGGTVVINTTTSPVTVKVNASTTVTIAALDAAFLN